MKQVYAEIGIGNGDSLSTEIEENGSEQRIAGFHLPKKITDVYICIWAGKGVAILSIKDGIKFTQKSKYQYKFLVGIGGVDDNE